MSTASVADTGGSTRPKRLYSRSTSAVPATVSITATVPCGSVTSSGLQLTLALTTGYHAGPLFIVQKRRAPVIHGGTLGGRRRRRRVWDQTPKWLTPWQRAWINALYREAKRLSDETGEMYVVDHIVPLAGKLVCGLHVPWNMRIIHWLPNCTKGWGTWPDMPFDQQELFD